MNKKLFACFLSLVFLVGPLAGCEDTYDERLGQFSGVENYFDDLPANLVATLHYQKADALFAYVRGWGDYFMQFVDDDALKSQIESGLQLVLQEAKNIQSATFFLGIYDLDSSKIEDENNYCVAAVIEHTSLILSQMTVAMPSEISVDTDGEFQIFRIKSCNIASMKSSADFVSRVKDLQGYDQNIIIALNVDSMKHYVNPLMDGFVVGFEEGMMEELERNMGAATAERIRPEFDKVWTFMKGLNIAKLLENMEYSTYALTFKDGVFYEESMLKLADTKYIPLVEKFIEGQVYRSLILLSESVRLDVSHASHGKWASTLVKMENPDLSVIFASPLGLFAIGMASGAGQYMYEMQARKSMLMPVDDVMME